MNFADRRQLANIRWQRALWMAAALLAIVATLVVFSSTNRTTASNVNVLANGNFEDGFVSIPGCGSVGKSWNCFTNGGAANYGFYDDQWDPVVANGEHSQLIEINTKGRFENDPERIAGVYQTVHVVPHANYVLNLKGMIRTTEMGGDPWRYRVEVGWVQGPSTDWHQVVNWYDAGWDTYYPRTEPGSFSQYTTGLTTASDKVTVFVRVRKKWGTPEMELDVNLDAISLTGPSPHVYHPPATATSTPTVVVKPTQPGYTPVPPASPTPVTAVSCGGADLVINGGFENSFYSTPLGMVGTFWAPFVNGGNTRYGFYDDQWSRVVVAGGHSQLIEINTKGLLSAESNRYAGIYQVISGLQAGTTYQLTVSGWLRGTGGGDDPYRFESQWGYMAGRQPNWEGVTNWQGIDLGKIYPRTDPGAAGKYTVKFVAPASEITLFLRGIKKWGTGETEFDLNLDAISMQRCTTTTAPPPPPSQCVYVVKPGDTLGVIAAKFGVSVHALATANHIANPNYIFVGQVLAIPGCAPYAPPTATPTTPPVIHPTPTATPPKTVTYYTVMPGDTLSSIAARYGVDLYYLAQVNSIVNINHIYVGQVLVIPGY